MNTAFLVGLLWYDARHIPWRCGAGGLRAPVGPHRGTGLALGDLRERNIAVG